ncbi:MAG: hypothetical protein ABIV50_15185 [Opitutus sp.]
MLESRNPGLPARPEIRRRVARSVCGGLALIGVSLVLVIPGYHGFEHLSRIDALHHAAVILSGTGPVAELHRTSGMFFVGWQAIYAGVAFISTPALAFAPITHRLSHRFRLEHGADN